MTFKLHYAARSIFTTFGCSLVS